MTSALVQGDRRGPHRRGADAAGVVACPVCRSEEAEAFNVAGWTNFRCRRCHTRYLVSLGYVVVVGERIS
ncbi:MAG TPA: hypothetical protein VFA11_06785 [Acidimicrobiales bacterium]|nr:hypothetical protein [Acidimicrobiales bacterium]